MTDGQGPEKARQRWCRWVAAVEGEEMPHSLEQRRGGEDDVVMGHFSDRVEEGSGGDHIW